MTRRVAVAIALLLALAPLPAAAAGWKLVDSDGRTHRLADYRGRWVLVNFWATWCGPCIDEIPELAGLAAAHRDRLAVIGVAVDWTDRDRVLRFAADAGANYPVILGGARETRMFGGVRGLPTSFLYDPRGRLASVHPGRIAPSAIEREIVRRR